MKGFGVAAALILVTGVTIFAVLGRRSQLKLVAENQAVRQQLVTYDLLAANAGR